MIDPVPRFESVCEEIQQALLQAQDVLNYVNTSPPAGTLRVAILNSLIVSLVSNIEEGIRLLLTTYITLIEDNIGSYAFVNKELAETNIRSAANLLLKSLKPDQNIQTLDVVQSLLKCLTNESGFKLFKDQITDNRANMRTKEITELAKRVGITSLWKVVGARPEARAAFPYLDDDQIVQTVAARWNELFDERDVVVHRISQASGWGETKIAPYFSFLGTVITCIANVLADDINKVIQTAAQRSGARAPGN